MDSPSQKMDVDKSPNHRSSSDTLKSRGSARSPSRDEKDRRDRDRRRERDEERRRRSRSRDKHSDRGNRDRERSRDHNRDKERDRERDRDRRREPRDRDRDNDRGHRSSHSHRDRERERDDKDRDRDRDRRRKRPDDEQSDRGADDRSKRKRSDDADDEHPAPPNGAPPPPPPAGTASPHGSERRLADRTPRDGRDSSPRYRDRRDDRRDRDRRRREYDDRERARRTRSPPPPPPPKRTSPIYDGPPQEDYNPDEPKEDDSEARSVFVSQLAARLTARDLGYFFEDKLGDGTVMDARIVTDRLSRRSKGIGYVEFRSIDLVEKAIGLSGTIVMGLPINVQLTESERNKSHAGDGSLHLPPGVTASGAILYVGSLHFNLTESDIRQVFEPFGELEFVDLHRDPMTGRSKGYAFVQYKRSEDARMALEQMEGFELAGRTLRVNNVHEKGSVRYTQTESLDDSGGGNLNAASRQALMQKLARTEQPAAPAEISKPHIPSSLQSRSVLLKNMFDAEEETEDNWDKDLAEDVKGECESKYGKVSSIKVEKDSQGEIYVKFEDIDSAKAAIQGLNGRWFGGRQISANFISDAIMAAHQ